jgi:hypothetical protein
MRAAPSFARVAPTNQVPPNQIVRRVLARFGDRRHVRGIRLGALPPRQRLKGFFPGERPPRDALWAYIDAPQADSLRLAGWEAALVAGALRDDFCSFGGRPLAGWSIGEIVRGVSDGSNALGQHFPNPSPKVFRERARTIGKRYGFRVASLRLLRPRQFAPLLIVETSRDRKEFVRDVRAIMALLDPVAEGSGGVAAITFEGFFFEARDEDGAFVRVDNVYRGDVSGGQWSWNPCFFPYEHTGFFGAESCPAP